MTPALLWSPPADALERTALGRFMAEAARRSGRSFDDYDALWQWSVDDLEGFWATVWDFFDVIAAPPYERVLSGRQMPGTQWFVGAGLNYAEHALRHRGDVAAIIGRSQTRAPITWTRDELADVVARVRTGLVRLGVGKGSRVAAYLPNVPETIAAFLATASLGAVWTSCAPEFGVRAVLDRFQQVEPTFLLAVDGYQYGHRRVSRSDELAEIRAGLPTLDATVLLPYPDEPSAADEAITWSELIRDTGPLEFERVAADHPLYILYSSGTTGLPKPIVHGHGGILLEHLKVLGLHADMNADDVFFWFTTTGWMMWNYLTAGLLHGACIVTFDGDPNVDGPGTLWQLAADTGVTWFGAGAPMLVAGQRAGLAPRDLFDLSRLRAIGSTGAPLPVDAFHWVYDSVKPDVLLSSISGGTDVCSAFVGGSPLSPVWAGEISCRYLGAGVAAFDESGQSVIGREGELVVRAPMPCMPVGLWGDADGNRLRRSYFERFPGVWCHGDWIVITERGSCVISGRSDATLNRGGVRIGTAEVYRVVETVPGVRDSLVVHLEDRSGGAGELVLFVVGDESLPDDAAELQTLLRSRLRTELSPRHAPDVVYRVAEIPTTLSGKKLELPVKRILQGAAAVDVASAGSLRNPASLEAIEHLASERRTMTRE
jgi:acetoacetyl-CoA synthetase